MNKLIEKFGEEKRWVNWETGTKIPKSISGRNALPNDPATWSTYSEVERNGKNIGIMFTPEKKLLGIDIDHCLQDKEIVHEEREKIIALLRKANTYTEISPSGTGLHLLLSITEPLSLIANRKGSFEAYTAGRYFTVTGISFGEEKQVRNVESEEAVALLKIIGYPWGKSEKVAEEINTPVENEIKKSLLSDNEILEKMFSSKNGEAVKSLYNGNTSAYDNDDSSADAALCLHLAFWTVKNVEQMEQIWLASPLGKREKTQNRKDYRDITISFAVENCKETYSGEFLKQNTHEDVVNQCNLLLSEIPKDTPKEAILKALVPLLTILASEASVEEAEIYIRNKVKDELKIQTKDIDSIIKYFKNMHFSATILKGKEALREAEELAKEPALTEEEIKAAEEILKSPTLLYDILKMVKKLGVVGEEKNVLLHYIILTSRNLKHPLSATVKGDSSSGKSYTLLTTLKLQPKSAYIDLTDATPQSFFYCPDDHFKHKIIIIFEKHGGERADYAIRTLQSEGKLKIQTTVQNPETGQFETQTIEKEGPTGFVTTTTASFIHAENDTRNISMFPDQSSEQTSRVYESVDSRYLGTKPINDNELKPWHHAQIILEQLPVYIPFVSSFRKHFPNHIVRTRRDYGHFLAILETIAFLHQKQRERIELNGQEYIRATLADAYMAKVIVEDSLSKSIYELPEKSIEVIKVARQALEKSEEESFGLDDEFTITDLSKILNWDRDTIAKWMKPVTKKGYMTIVQESKGSKGAKYKLEGKELPGDNFLPSVWNLVLDNPEESIENIYNPLTGETISGETKNEVLSTDALIDSEGQQNTASVEEAPVKPIGASVENMALFKVSRSPLEGI